MNSKTEADTVALSRTWKAFLAPRLLLFKPPPVAMARGLGHRQTLHLVDWKNFLEGSRAE